MGRPVPIDRSRRWTHGYTLVELLVSVAVISIVGGIAVPTFQSVLRRERVGSVAYETAGWLEEARALSAREVNPDAQAGGCAIVLSGSLSAAEQGAVLAGLTGCAARSSQLRIGDTWGGSFRIAHSIATGAISNAPSAADCTAAGIPAGQCAGSLALFFTPRGMWSSDSVQNLQTDLEIRIAPADGGGPKRCVRLSSILGSIDIGEGADGNVTTGCERYGQL
ncbi:MAG: prepilin-type N-terminal cleavage/methylation domain-containing protein [Chitinophagaceae bacterium]|nr:prepilin-type N-terminal cleavage/methylation domain-containing protein [Chitinophagaceae bacterium]